MMAKKKSNRRKIRIQFKSNRSAPGREGDLTRRYHSQRDQVEDGVAGEAIRAKGALSRKRTIIVGDDDAPSVDEALWRPGIVVTIRGQVALVEDADGENWDCTTRRVLRTILIESRSAVCVGDRVWFSDQSQVHGQQRAGVIERVEPRRGTLSRRERRGREHTLVANAEQLLIVASVARPGLKPHLIDRYLVAAIKGDLRPIICFNKWDLLVENEGAEAADDDEASEWISDDGSDGDGAEEGEEERGEFVAFEPDDVIAEFERLGYRCLRTSALQGVGLDELRSELRGRMTVLSGQSGVGKSSLLNALQPGLGLAVQEVSSENEKGKHTTTHGRLFKLDEGGHVVDTPGIRQFELWNVAPGELEACFTEFVPIVPRCKFKDCHHTDEEGCAVSAAVDSGELSARRYLSYLKILNEISRKGR